MSREQEPKVTPAPCCTPAPVSCCPVFSEPCILKLTLYFQPLCPLLQTFRFPASLFTSSQLPSTCICSPHRYHQVGSSDISMASEGHCWSSGILPLPFVLNLTGKILVHGLMHSAKHPMFYYQLSFMNNQSLRDTLFSLGPTHLCPELYQGPSQKQVSIN